MRYTLSVLVWVVLVSVRLLGTHGRPLSITPCQAQEDVILLLESAAQELAEKEEQMRKDGLDPAEMYNDTSHKTAQAFSVLYQIECYSRQSIVATVRISKDVLDKAVSVQQALRMLGHEAPSPTPCPSLEHLSYWNALVEVFFLLHNLKTWMQELQLGCTT